MMTNDGQLLEGSTPEELLSELHGLSHSPCVDDETYMLETAARIGAQFGKPARVDSVANFISDLIDMGLLINKDIVFPPDVREKISDDGGIA